MNSELYSSRRDTAGLPDISRALSSRPKRLRFKSIHSRYMFFFVRDVDLRLKVLSTIVPFGDRRIH